MVDRLQERAAYLRSVGGDGGVFRAGIVKTVVVVGRIDWLG